MHFGVFALFAAYFSLDLRDQRHSGIADLPDRICTRSARALIMPPTSYPQNTLPFLALLIAAVQFSRCNNGVAAAYLLWPARRVLAAMITEFAFSTGRCIVRG